MGAITPNRNKRDAEFQSSSPFGFGRDHLRPSKKLRPSSGSPSTCVAPTKRSTNSVSRLSLYPKQVTPITRDIHAPCRVVNGFTGSLRKGSGGCVGIAGRKPDPPGDSMGNSLFSKYNHAKEAAIGSCRHVMFEEERDVVEVIDVENVEAVKDDNAASGNSGVEEVEMAEDGREEIHRSRDAQKIIAKYRELDEKAEENPGFQPSTSSGLVSAVMDGKMLELLSLSEGSEKRDSAEKQRMYAYQQLRDSVEKRDSRLRRLDDAIKLEELRRHSYQQLRPAKKKEDKITELFQPLTNDEMEMVDTALSNSKRRKVLVTHEPSNIIITGEVLQCLRPRAWLNDEVINIYLELLKEREKREPQMFLKCHFFSTFFYKKLLSGRNGYDYKAVRRWTTMKKLGYNLLECDKIFVPIHKEIHWCLAVINKKEEKFQYLDSLGGMDKQVMRVLAKYIVDEVKDKTGNDIDVSSWKQEYVTDFPNQENGYDCGMFMIKYADFYSRDMGLCFTQENMPYFRLRTAKEILRLRAD